MSDSNTIQVDQTGGQPANSTGGANPLSTGNGFLTGVQPAAQPGSVTQTNPQGLSAAELALVQQHAAQAAQAAVAPQGETLAEMQQRMAAMQTELDAARTAREASEAEAAAAEQARLDAERAAAESTMSATELVGQVRAEMQAEFAAIQERAAASEALLERERRYSALQDYKAQRLADPEIAAAVMPHLHPYIVGGSEQEIEEAIARAAQTSSSIVAEFQQYQQQYRQQAPGVSPTAPTTGPMEQQQATRPMSAQEIAALPDAEYARLRPQLLRAAGQQFRAQRGG
jgi:hypothetical protein